jgi:dihydrofolate reductase
MMPASPVPLVLVAAVARNGVIGGDNRLLWKLRSDMRHFRTLTMGRPMIMGRRTFESIGQALPGRETIVVTRGDAAFPAGVHRATSIDAALALGQERAQAMGAPEVIVAGGAELYRELIDRCDRLEITEVDLSPEGDARFPDIDPKTWREVRREGHPPADGDETSFTFVGYERQTAQYR